MARHHALPYAAAIVAMAQLACSDVSTTPTTLSPNASVALDRGKSDTRQIKMMDECDPLSFNAALGDGTCTRSGRGLKLEQFRAQLARLGRVPGWHFAPSTLEIKLGQSFNAYNGGGEEHTFTEVEHFGGGIIPALNAASGNPVPAPECLQLAAGDFIAPGHSTAPDTPDEAGVEHYQCCIHPWMRADVEIR